MEKTDWQLIQACRQGEQQAWEELVSRYERLVFSIPLNFGLTREDAADIAQHTFIILVDPSENVWGAWVDAGTGEIHLSARGAFAVPGVTGDGADVFVCAPGSLGSQTTCAFGPGLYWDGSADGFGAEILDGIAVGGGG